MSKKYNFDITVTGDSYAGELALPYVTAAVKSGRSIATGAVDVLEGITDKAVIKNVGRRVGICILRIYRR